MKIFMSVFLLLISMSAVALAEESLDVRTVVQKEEVVITEDGNSEKRLVPAEVVTPGETVVYTNTVSNVGEESAGDVVITNPIAESLVYIDGSASGPGMDIQFSVDGGETFGAPDDLSVSENGGVRSATARDYTHIRWVMTGELDVGAQAIARFAAILE